MAQWIALTVGVVGIGYLFVTAFVTSKRERASAPTVTSPRSGPGLLRRREVSRVIATPGPQQPEEESKEEGVVSREADEYERVLSHVEQMLREECGFNAHQAAALAEAGVDWHEAKRLITLGCDHLTAVDLLT